MHHHDGLVLLLKHLIRYDHLWKEDLDDSWQVIKRNYLFSVEIPLVECLDEQVTIFRCDKLVPAECAPITRPCHTEAVSP